MVIPSGMVASIFHSKSKAEQVVLIQQNSSRGTDGTEQMRTGGTVIGMTFIGKRTAMVTGAVTAKQHNDTNDRAAHRHKDVYVQTDQHH